MNLETIIVDGVVYDVVKSDDGSGICHEKKWCNNLWHDWNPPRVSPKRK